MIEYNNYLHNAYMLLGIISNLDMIYFKSYSLQRKVWSLYKGLEHQQILVPTEVLDSISHRYWRRAVFIKVPIETTLKGYYIMSFTKFWSLPCSQTAPQPQLIRNESICPPYAHIDATSSKGGVYYVLNLIMLFPFDTHLIFQNHRLKENTFCSIVNYSKRDTLKKCLTNNIL
jgi:hypothetical protein